MRKIGGYAITLTTNLKTVHAVPGTFNYEVPSVTAITPPSLCFFAGAAVTVTGAGFGTSAGSTNVYFTAAKVPCEAPFSFVSTTEFRCTAPALTAATGARPFYVKVNGWEELAAVTVLVSQSCPPAVTSVVPSVLYPTGGAVTILGSNFGRHSAGVAVTYGGTSCTGVAGIISGAAAAGGDQFLAGVTCTVPSGSGPGRVLNIAVSPKGALPVLAEVAYSAAWAVTYPTLSSFSGRASSFAGGGVGFAAAALGQWMYVIGGGGSDGARLDTVDLLGVAPTATSTTALAGAHFPRQAHCAVAAPSLEGILVFGGASPHWSSLVLFKPPATLTALSSVGAPSLADAACSLHDEDAMDISLLVFMGRTSAAAVSSTVWRYRYSSINMLFFFFFFFFFFFLTNIFNRSSFLDLEISRLFSNQMFIIIIIIIIIFYYI
jgi:hypothetical protein